MYLANSNALQTRLRKATKATKGIELSLLIIGEEYPVPRKKRQKVPEVVD